MSIFNLLLDDDVIATDSFEQWRDSTSEPKGKGMSIITTIQLTDLLQFISINLCFMSSSFYFTLIYSNQRSGIEKPHNIL